MNPSVAIPSGRGSAPCFDLDRKPGMADLELRSGTLQPALHDPKPAHPVQKDLEQDTAFQASQMGADAMMPADAQRQMARRLSMDVEALPVRKLPLVAIGGLEQQEEPIPTPDAMAAEIDVFERRPADMLKDTLMPKHLLEDRGSPGAVAAECLPGSGLSADLPQSARDHLRDRLGRAEQERHELRRELGIPETLSIHLEAQERRHHVAGRRAIDPTRSPGPRHAILDELMDLALNRHSGRREARPLRVALRRALDLREERPDLVRLQGEAESPTGIGQAEGSREIPHEIESPSTEEWIE